MKTRSTSRPDAAEERRNAAGSRPAAQMKPAAAAVMLDARAASLAQLRQQEQAGNSTQAAQLKAHAELMAAGLADTPVKRLGEEKLMQGNFGVAPVPTISGTKLRKMTIIQKMAKLSDVQTVQRQPVIWFQGKELDLGLMDLLDLKELAAISIKDPMHQDAVTYKQLDELEKEIYRREEESKPIKSSNLKSNEATALTGLDSIGNSAIRLKNELGGRAGSNEENLPLTGKGLGGQVISTAMSVASTGVEKVANVITGGISGKIMSGGRSVDSGARAFLLRNILNEMEHDVGQAHNLEQKEEVGSPELRQAIESLAEILDQRAVGHAASIVIPGASAVGNAVTNTRWKDSINILKTSTNSVAKQVLALLGETSIEEPETTYGSFGSRISA